MDAAISISLADDIIVNSTKPSSPLIVRGEAFNPFRKSTVPASRTLAIHYAPATLQINAIASGVVLNATDAQAALPINGAATGADGHIVEASTRAAVARRERSAQLEVSRRLH